MRKKEAIEAFGGVRALAAAIGVTPQAVYDWPDQVPELRQYQIEKILRERDAKPASQA